MLIEKVKSAIKSYALLERNDTVLIGVSGGPDSLALLYALNAIKEKWGLKLQIAHLDHGLRPESPTERKFVESIAKKLNIPAAFARVKIGSVGSQEENARKARLSFFFKTAKKIKADKIALGHNRDDQAETVLMRILRGTGLYGLIGILPKREISGFQLIRPLIGITRKEIERFLKRKGIAFLRDRTNAQDIYFRNKIRNKLLPLLEEHYNKNIREVLCNLAESSGLDYDYLYAAALRKSKGSRNKLSIKKILRLHPAMRRLVLRSCIANLAGDTRRLRLKNIREIEDLLYSRPVNSIVDLPKGVSAVKKKKDLLFYRRKK